jgi:hypothetical protein
LPVGGFDDLFVFCARSGGRRAGNAILGRDGCMNFFAGPDDQSFGAKLNLYDVHYNSTHLMGTTGGNTDDLIESLRLTACRENRPGMMITHVGGLDSAAETILNLPHIPG